MSTSFVAAMKQFFGLLPGQAISSFAAELKALSHEEKMQFSNMLQAHIPHDPPSAPKQA